MSMDLFLASWLRHFARLTQLISSILLLCVNSHAEHRSSFEGVSSEERRSSRVCSIKSVAGMRLVAKFSSYGEICEPPGKSVSARIIGCFSPGKEAVLIPEAPGVVCAARGRGRMFLRQNPKYAANSKSELAEVCRRYDKRVLPRDIVEQLVESQTGGLVSKSSASLEEYFVKVSTCRVSKSLIRCIGPVNILLLWRRGLQKDTRRNPECAR